MALTSVTTDHQRREIIGDIHRHSIIETVRLVFSKPEDVASLAEKMERIMAAETAAKTPSPHSVVKTQGPQGIDYSFMEDTTGAGGLKVTVHIAAKDHADPTRYVHIKPLYASLGHAASITFEKDRLAMKHRDATAFGEDEITYNLVHQCLRDWNVPFPERLGPLDLGEPKPGFISSRILASRAKYEEKGDGKITTQIAVNRQVE